LRSSDPQRRVLLIASAVALMALGGTMAVALSQAIGQPGRQRAAALHFVPTARLTSRPTAAPTSPAAAQDPTGPGHIYHVSKAGDNGDGLSWQSAWNELSSVNWSVVQPGDTILVDGGPAGMTYTTELTVRKSGSDGNPITIEKSVDPGHNGQVVLFGGRSVPLPYYGEPAADYNPGPGPINSVGIDMTNASWIVIDGMSWHGISIHGEGWQGGIDLSDSSSNDTFQNLEIYDNGSWFTGPGNTLESMSPGVLQAGSNLVFSNADIHDNGDDAFSSPYAVHGLTISYTWIHNSRPYPDHPSTGYNIGVHDDGLQIFGGGHSTGIEFDHDIIGPGKTNSFINDSSVGYSAGTVFRDVLFLDPASHNIVPDSSNVSDWIMDHLTLISQAGNLELAGSNHTLTNSIVYDGNVQTHNYPSGTESLTTVSNNCEWHVTAPNEIPGAKIADPQFMTDLSSYQPYLNIDNPPIYATDSYPTLDFLSHADFSLKPGSPCAGMGSAVTSVSQFLRMVGGA
jgi:hypothetical protein